MNFASSLARYSAAYAASTGAPTPGMVACVLLIRCIQFMLSWPMEAEISVARAPMATTLVRIPLVRIHKGSVFRHGLQRGFGSAVHRAGTVLLGAFGAHIDDTSAVTLGQKHIDGLAHGAHGAVYVDGHKLIKLFVQRVAYGGHIVHDACIVYQNIQLPKFLNGEVNHLLVDFLLGDIAYENLDFTRGIL